MPVAGKTVHVRSQARTLVRSWRLITVRLRSKSCPAGGHDGQRQRELGERRSDARHLQQASVGSKTRSAGWVSTQGLSTGSPLRRREKGRKI